MASNQPPRQPAAPTDGAPSPLGQARDRRSQPKRRGGRIRSLLLAVLVHLLLLGLLFVGVRWNTQKPVAVQAELWTPPPPVRPAPKSEPVVEPKPEPAPEPKAETPPEPAPVAKPQDLPKPDIALEKQREDERKKKAEEKKAAEKKAEEKRAAEEKKAAEAKKLAEEKKLAEAKKAADEKKAADDKKLAEEKKAAEDKKAEAKKLAEAKRTADDDEKRREEYLKRLIDQAEKSGDTSKPSTQAGQAVGAAAGGATGGADAGYAAQVASVIRSNTTFMTPPDLAGNPRAVFIVSLTPDCGVISVKLKRSSGLPNWDAAAERAIARSDPFPRPRSGRCERELEIAHGPRDLRP